MGKDICIWHIQYFTWKCGVIASLENLEALPTMGPDSKIATWAEPEQQLFPLTWHSPSCLPQSLLFPAASLTWRQTSVGIYQCGCTVFSLEELRENELFVLHTFASAVGKWKVDQAFLCLKKNGKNLFISTCENIPTYLLYKEVCLYQKKTT